MNSKQFLPQHKDDYESIIKLKELCFDEFSPYVGELLTWIQDMNWPISRDIANILSSYTNRIEEQILEVLKGSDDLWKYWCIQELLLHSKERNLSNNLVNELIRIVKHPTDGEIEEDVVEIAKNTLANFCIKLS